MNRIHILFGLIAILCFSCKKHETEVQEPRLILRFAFDANQERLDNLGNPSTVPAGHAAQSPDFHTISAHYVELAPSALTWLGDGAVLYDGAETDAGGPTAIDFSKSTVVTQGQDFLSIPLKDVPTGSYTYLRVSLAYQNYSVDYLYSGFDLTGTVASFIGYNTYIGTYTIDTQPVVVNDDRLQGYWGLETNVLGTPYVTTGQAPEGATTVPNPLWDTSPIPAGSCIVTGPFASAFQITGSETEDVVITMSLSTNNSFEWTEVNADGKFEPSAGESVVDMGIRGLIPIVN